MRLRDLALVSFGGVIVWLGVSCAAARLDDADRAARKDADPETHDVLGDVVAIMDSLVHDSAPKDAAAAPPTTVSASCSVERSGTMYAEAAFPGRTMTDLARTTVVACSATEQPAGSGYKCATGTLLVRDGSIAYACGAKGFALPTSVTFVVP